MGALSAGIFRLNRLRFLTGVIAFSFHTANLLAAEPPGIDEVAPTVGCGKAQAAARSALSAPEEPLPLAFAEALQDTDVVHYDLDVEVTNINTTSHNCTITGRNVMTIQSRSASLTEFTFRLRSQYTLTAALVNGGTPVSVSTVNATTRLVTLNRAYGTDEVFTLTIDYTGTSVSADPFGSIEVENRPDGQPVVGTLSEPYYAYTWWPAKDGDVALPGDNSDKATINFSITVPDVYEVPSNGVLQGVDVLTGNRKRYRWATGYPMATYLLSFAVSDYNTWTATYNYPGGSMPVEFYIYPYASNDTAANRAAWENVVTMMATFRPIYGEYPFVEEKYGLYNFPFGGGMEHQTMTGQSGYSESLTSHELAHQWWGDMITCKTWNHIWLNEGFATYSEALWVERKPGSTGLTALKNYMTNIRYTGSGTVHVPDAELGSVSRIFNGSLSYRKGAWVLHMLRHVMGDADFFAALAAYRAAFEFGAATTEDFQSICEGIYGDSLEWFFQEWIYGEFVPSYNWGWTGVQVNGQHYLLVSIDQTQPANQQRFTMPIDIVVNGVTHTVYNDADPEHFVVPISDPPTVGLLDPDNWVLKGTVSNLTYSPGPPVIVETAPAPGETVLFESAVDTVAVYFPTGVNTSLSDFSLIGDSLGAQGFSISGTTNVNPVVMELDAPLLPDTYTLTVRDTLGTVNGALDGEVADAEDPSSLPSGEGVAGGDAVIRFHVVATGTPGDFEPDADVDADDATAFQSCYSPLGLVSTGCEPGNLDLDGNIDCRDWMRFKLLWTGAGDPPDFPTCDAFNPPAAMSDLKNRYVSFLPGATGGPPQAFRLTVVSNPRHPGTVGQQRWLTAPDAAGVSGLGCAPVFRDWGTEPVDVGDDEVVPGATYALEATMDGTSFVGPVELLGAPVWGDLVGQFDVAANRWRPPDGSVDIIDAVAVLDCFRGVAHAPPMTWADLDPAVPNGEAEIIDVVRSLDAFRGRPYPFAAADPCE